MKAKNQSPQINLNEWMEEAFPPSMNKKPPGSFTIDDVLKRTRMNESTIRGRLRRKVIAGELTQGYCYIGGKRILYYLPVVKSSAKKKK